MFFSLEVVNIVGCSYRQLDYWCRTGVLGSRLETPVGSGGKRVFSRHDALRVAVLHELNMAWGSALIVPEPVARWLPRLSFYGPDIERLPLSYLITAELDLRPLKDLIEQAFADLAS